MLFLVSSNLFSSFPSFTPFKSSSSVTQSTINRKPLEKGSVVETDYYIDNLGWIDSGSVLTSGMRSFYQKTGVQPFLYITDTINGIPHPINSDLPRALDEFAEQLYDELFSDEAHILVIFYERDKEYEIRYLAGRQAKTVVDSEGADILMDYIEMHYYGNLNDDEMFSRAFSEAADRMMSVTRPNWWLPLICVIALVGLIIMFTWWNKRTKQKNLEAEQAERMLNTPLNEIGRNTTGLEDKYE